MEEGDGDEVDRAFCFRVCQPRGLGQGWGPDLLIAASSDEERSDWVNNLLELTNQANAKVRCSYQPTPASSLRRGDR